MSKRLQVVMTEGEYEEIRDAAERRRVSVSEWVRQSLRAARERELRGAPLTVHESKPRYGDERATLPRRVEIQARLKEDHLEAVRQRYRLPDWRAAVQHAVERAAIRPMTKEEALAMRGVGWSGDLDEIRSGDPGDLW